MFLKELVELNRMCFHEKIENWKDAIQASCQPLVEEGAIEQTYIDAMIASIEKYGPYIILAPDIAMPHSQEGAEGVNKTAISFMKVEEPVSFEEGNPEKDARLFFVLASQNNEQHMDNMQKLAEMLLIPDVTEKLLQIKSKEDMLKLDEELTKALA